MLMILKTYVSKTGLENTGLMKMKRKYFSINGKDKTYNELVRKRMYGGGYGGVPGYTAPGYTNSVDACPFTPGTQVSGYDADLTTPGVQVAGTTFNSIPHQSSAYDQNPFVSGTQIGGVTVDNGMGMGMGMGMGGMGVGMGTEYSTSTTTTYGTGLGGGYGTGYY